MLRKLLIALMLVCVPGGICVAAVAAQAVRSGRLGLAADQKEKLRSLRFAARTEAIRTHAELKIKRMELRQLLTAPELDRKAVDQKVAEISTLRTQALKARVEHLLAARSVLTPEQREKLRDLGPRNQNRHRAQPQGEGDGDSPRGGEGAGPA